VHPHYEEELGEQNSLLTELLFGLLEIHTKITNKLPRVNPMKLFILIIP